MRRMPDSKGTKFPVLPHKPEDWPRLFMHHFNSGDLEAVATLCAPNTRFLARYWETVVGRDQTRDMLTRMIQSKTKFQSQVIRAISVDDVAVL
jgi:limonene-1,2-epoxide hydrolase